MTKGLRFETLETKQRKFKDDLKSGFGSIKVWMKAPLNQISDVKFVYSEFSNVYYVDSTGKCEVYDVAIPE